MEKLSPPIQVVANLLSHEEVITPSSPLYAELSRTWAAQKNLKPRLIAQPKDLPSLSRLIGYLGNSGLDFDVRCAGVGSASAKDVLISMSAFGSFEFDRHSETVIIGAGQTWAQVNSKMEHFAPGYAGMTSGAGSIVGTDIFTSCQRPMRFRWSGRLNTYWWY